MTCRKKSIMKGEMLVNEDIRRFQLTFPRERLLRYTT